MFEIGVDVGGTFTDVVCYANGKPIAVMKLPTTRQDPSEGVLAALRQLAERYRVEPHLITRFVHGTTVATNAVIERRGPIIGLLTTRGFKDVLEIGRQMRRQMYDAILQPETPTFLAPGAMRKEVIERLSANGAVIEPLDESSCVAAASELVARGASAVAICFLHSYLNAEHERKAAEIISRIYPNLYISISSEVDPAFREYERTVVTAFDAYIKPVVDEYLSNLEGGLKQVGVRAPLQVMQSRGGVSISSIARQRPVRLFLSGPAAGVIGGQCVAAAAGINEIITVDIGGTSTDIALVCSGKPLTRAEGLVAGYSVRVAMVDVNAIGAGGGSVAWVDTAGGLRVGPRSAGSDPGPACYGVGGEEPTVTDASIVLGYIDPACFAGGTLRVDPELARLAIQKRIAEPLGLSVEEAALGIHRVVNAQMAEGIRLVSIKQGFAPRNFTLVSMGGGGGIHAAALADELGINRVLIPRFPGVLSAIGLLAANIEHEKSISFSHDLHTLSLDSLMSALAKLDAACGELMRQEAVGGGVIEKLYFADACYIGQSHYLEIPIDLHSADVIKQLYLDFVATHERVFGHSQNAPVQVINLRAIHLVKVKTPSVALEEKTSISFARQRFREIRLVGNSDPVRARILAREELTAGTLVKGPAIIEQADTTTLVPQGWEITHAPGDNLLMAKVPG